jgi:hypothetical protein
MVLRKLSRSAGVVLGLVALIEVGGCEGESSSGDDDGPAKGGTGGASGASTGGFSGDAGVGPGGTTGKGGNPAGGIGGTSGIGGDLGGGPVTGGIGGDAGQGPQGGDSGDAGQGPGGDGGSGGAPDTTTVHGRVIDFWRVPLGGMVLTIGTTTVSTNGNGEFTIPDVAPQYDVQLVSRFGTSSTRTEVYGWRYEGLTRRDPTLQVYKGRALRSTGYIFTPMNAVLGNDGVLAFAVAGRDGSYTHSGVSESGVQSSFDWVGPVSMPSTAHALLWDVDGDDIPTGYRSYDTTALTLTEGTQANISLNVANETTQTGNIAGTVTRNMTDDDANMVFVRFAGGARISLVEDSSGTNTYSYLVPTLPSGSITVAASTGYWSFGEYAVAHRDGLAPRTGVNITVPLPPTQVAPPTQTTGATTATTFSWTAGTSHAYVLGIENLDFYEGGYVVTARTQTKLPSFENEGYAWRKAGDHNWRVETHGNASTVDELCGPNGFIDSMGFYIDDVVGPGTGDGSYTISTGRTFTTAP